MGRLGNVFAEDIHEKDTIVLMGLIGFEQLYKEGTFEDKLLSRILLWEEYTSG